MYQHDKVVSFIYKLVFTNILLVWQFISNGHCILYKLTPLALGCFHRQDPSQPLKRPSLYNSISCLLIALESCSYTLMSGRICGFLCQNNWIACGFAHA